MRNFAIKLLPKIFIIAMLLLIIITAASTNTYSPAANRLTSMVPSGNGATPTTKIYHAFIGIGLDTEQDVRFAAQTGIQMDLHYGIAPSPTSPLGLTLTQTRMHVIDAGLSSLLSYYECHRTHTVVPPPQGQDNTYCPDDMHPEYSSKAVLLHNIETLLQADATNPLVVGYWVLDDWPAWDAGSARQLLTDIHASIARYTPAYPAICGMGMDIDPPGVNGWISYPAKNFSSAGCDMVGVYAYAAHQSTPRNGNNLDWSLLTSMAAFKREMLAQGWQQAQTPLIGIGQGYSGPYGSLSLFEPGLTAKQIHTESLAFCRSFGAVALAWYAWNDPAYISSGTPQTQTPENNANIIAGLVQSMSSCRAVWWK